MKAIICPTSMYWLFFLQAAELQQYSAGQKAVQEEMRGLQKVAHTHEEARIKAEVSNLAPPAASLYQLFGDPHRLRCHLVGFRHAGFERRYAIMRVFCLPAYIRAHARALAASCARVYAPADAPVCYGVGPAA